MDTSSVFHASNGTSASRDHQGFRKPWKPRIFSAYRHSLCSAFAADCPFAVLEAETSYRREAAQPVVRDDIQTVARPDRRFRAAHEKAPLRTGRWLAGGIAFRDPFGPEPFRHSDYEVHKNDC